eukprot:TRINITY_DN3104_c0_g1_i2.p1 TRINITY_DN3104_c0_g1~~TRINITY_DN3104_c0_g1_i2.p1  ORF type:complete len:245 (+),score=41.52 TRINITY_DN3104_c0_g1_i2:329-1063(+)
MDELLSDFRCVHMPLPDAATCTTSQAKEWIEVCEEARRKKEAVLVHCWMGSRRSWFMARLAVRAIESPSLTGEELNRQVRGDNSRKNAISNSYLSADNANFPFPPSPLHEQTGLHWLGAGLDGVQRLGCLPHSEYSEEREASPAEMLTVGYPVFEKDRSDNLKFTHSPASVLFGEDGDTSGGDGTDLSAEDGDAAAQVASRWSSLVRTTMVRACGGDEEEADRVLAETRTKTQQEWCSVFRKWA